MKMSDLLFYYLFINRDYQALRELEINSDISSTTDPKTAIVGSILNISLRQIATKYSDISSHIDSLLDNLASVEVNTLCCRTNRV
jgi:hypothetical protein